MKKIISLTLITTLSLGLVACTSNNQKDANASDATALSSMRIINGHLEDSTTDDKYRTTYEVFVYSFCDSDGDRVGDINGLISKLDYIDELGCNGIWLMPVMPSPSYHKYDITDYKNIDSAYGTLDDFSNLVNECHDRGIDLYIDFVMNHTSSQHPWFKEAVEYLSSLEEGQDIDYEACKYVQYYNFITEPKNGYAPVPGTDNRFYYECRFVSEMPDVNLDSAAVMDEYKDIAKFWYDLGVDGYRMDAVTSYYTEDTQASINVLSEFAEYVHGLDPNLYIVTEAWTAADTYDRYLESGVDSTFEFEFSQAEGYIAKALNTGKASTYAKHLDPSVKGLRAYNEAAIPAPFYTNHDTARTGGYYTGEFATQKAKMGWAMSLTMTGNSFLYYGEELGMRGSGDDENKRQAFLWCDDTNAKGMATALKATKNIDNRLGSLKQQQDDGDSIYNFVKEVIRIRNSSPVISHGEAVFVEEASTDSCCVVEKEYQDKKMWLLYNVGAESQTIDLSKIKGEATIYGAALTNYSVLSIEDDAISVPG
mgnify:CR=1 FL=1